MIAAPSTPLAIVVAALGLLFGLVLTFSGYRLAKRIATIAGLLTGVVLGLGIGARVAGAVGAIIGAIVLGLALALAFRFAFRFIGAIVGVLGGVSVATDLVWPLWALVACAVVGGVAGYLLNKLALVTVTAIVGAVLAVTSAVQLFDVSGYRLTMETASVLACTILLAGVGVLSQMRSLRGEDEALAPRGNPG